VFGSNFFHAILKLPLLGDGGYFPAKEVFDLSIFHGLEDGAFEVSHCKNYHRLGNLKSLSFYGCESIVDVSCFQKIPKLRLQSCPKLRNVSCLGGVHDLDLCGNEQITDVSALGNVRSLNLLGCINVVDVSALSKVEKLNLRGCSCVTDVSGLQAVVDLDISGCLEISNVTMLHNLKSLEMRGCEKINDLTGLINLRNLTIDGKVKLHSNSLQVISQLAQLSTDENPIIMKDGFEQAIWSPEHFEFLQNIRKLNLLRCPSLTEFPSFSPLQSLSITGCDSFTSLPVLPSLGYLDIRNCKKLKTIKILGTADLTFPLYRMKVYGCTVKTISIRRKVFHCTISCCSKLLTVKVHNPMDLLQITECRGLQKIVNKSSIVCVDVEDKGRFYDREGTDIEFSSQGKEQVNVRQLGSVQEFVEELRKQNNL
jgi:hypothetical protein